MVLGEAVRQDKLSLLCCLIVPTSFKKLHLHYIDKLETYAASVSSLRSAVLKLWSVDS